MPLGLIFVPAFTYLNEQYGFNFFEITISVLHQGGIWKKTTAISPYCVSVYLCSASNRLCSTPVTLSFFSLFHKGATPLSRFACEQRAPWQPRNRLTHPSDSQTEITAGSKAWHPPVPESCPSVLSEGVRRNMCFSEKHISPKSQAEHILHISHKVLKSPYVDGSSEWLVGGWGFY